MPDAAERFERAIEGMVRDGRSREEILAFINRQDFRDRARRCSNGSDAQEDYYDADRLARTLSGLSFTNEEGENLRGSARRLWDLIRNTSADAFSK